MKFKIFGFTISNENNDLELASLGARAKTTTSKEKISQALKEIERKQIKYSEYKLQKQSGLSINTIKKYRKFIEQEQKRINKTLF